MHGCVSGWLVGWLVGKHEISLTFGGKCITRELKGRQNFCVVIP